MKLDPFLLGKETHHYQQPLITFFHFLKILIYLQVQKMFPSSNHSQFLFLLSLRRLLSFQFCVKKPSLNFLVITLYDVTPVSGSLLTHPSEKTSEKNSFFIQICLLTTSQSYFKIQMVCRTFMLKINEGVIDYVIRKKINLIVFQ